MRCMQCHAVYVSFTVAAPLMHHSIIIHKKREKQNDHDAVNHTIIPISTGRYLVNLDKDVTSLIAETKHLLRMGVEVPDSARALLLQEARLRGHLSTLTSLLTVRGVGVGVVLGLAQNQFQVIKLGNQPHVHWHIHTHTKHMMGLLYHPTPCTSHAACTRRSIMRWSRRSHPPWRPC